MCFFGCISFWCLFTLTQNVTQLSIFIMKSLQFSLNIFYFGCFAILALFSIEKFLIGRTITEIRFLRIQLNLCSLSKCSCLYRKTKVAILQFPSVSVCVEYSFKKYIDGVILRNETSLEKAEKLIKSNIWKRNETFYFVNHKNLPLGDFPCMTTSESPDRGRPCNFPFIYVA